MAQVAIRNVSKSFGAVPVLHGVSVDIADGQFLLSAVRLWQVALLRMVAGPRPSAAAIRSATRRSTVTAGQARHRHGVPEHALYPHKTAQNMAFPEAQGTDRDRRRACQEAADISTCLPRALPRQLSGGQRQRNYGAAPSCAIPSLPVRRPLSISTPLRVQMRTRSRLHQRRRPPRSTSRTTGRGDDHGHKIVVMQSGHMSRLAR